MTRSTMHLVSTDTLYWSNPEFSFRVRLDTSKLPDPYLSEDATDTEKLQSQFSRRRSLKQLLKSNTKARRFHGYLEGNYKMASFGFYTNNLEGVKKLYQKYPELFVSVQRYDQYKSALQLANFLSGDE